jgi:RimJ/RimL family protein N-acetyltransferase
MMSDPHTTSEPQEIRTPRLRLRQLRASDAAVIGLYASDPRVARMTTTIPHPYFPGMAQAFVDRARAPGARMRVWALDAGLEGENGLIGIISLQARAERELELGYWVAPAFWGTGYASEAVEAIVAHAGQGFDGTITAEVLQDNHPAAKVLTRSGFQYLGEGEAHSVARGAMVPTFRYGLETASLRQAGGG